MCEFAWYLLHASITQFIVLESLCSYKTNSGIYPYIIKLVYIICGLLLITCHKNQVLFHILLPIFAFKRALMFTELIIISYKEFVSLQLLRTQHCFICSSIQRETAIITLDLERNFIIDNWSDIRYVTLAHRVLNTLDTMISC